ncbi:UDP-N-acetylmuramoyl-tripeptide--D-alanyl-D-alanine ligase [Caulobacter sp. KR2-114]|uniref:UDP-N-acetylmuramoyl-tripeptide--D-alanyl-D- alanine ligase n=1 Tax=Caulobacter sp. KR2-114 TaxID=3400912 RepID=UPI003C0AF197
MTEPLWTAEAIVAATHGRLTGAPFQVTGVTTDSREVEAGDLFVALAGERDGNDFVAGAFGRGAAGALVSRDLPGSCIVVDDTLKALERLGEAARVRAPAARRGAVTGSVGKTSVTQAIRAGLARAGRAHASVKSYNNHIGVPLTLARMPADTERAVFEIGMNHADEITPLTRMVRPHAVAITTVGAVHVEAFPDGEAGVARAKAEIFDGLEPGGVAVLNADNRWFDYLSGEARKAGAVVRSFGSVAGADARLIRFTAGESSARVEAVVDGQQISFPLLQTGSHWGTMSLCVILMLLALDVDMRTALQALSEFEPLAGRGAERQVRIAGGAFTLVDDSYNANPLSVGAALKTLGARQAPGRRIAVLTDMLELGDHSPRYHAELKAPIEAADVDLVFAAGPLMKNLWDALSPTRRGGYAEDAAGVQPQIVGALRPGDVVLVKGSKSSNAKALADALAALDPLAEGDA